jgi:hypothetical protein
MPTDPGYRNTYGGTTTTRDRRPRTHGTWRPSGALADDFRRAIGYYPGNPAYNPEAFAGYQNYSSTGATGPTAPAGPASPGGGGRGYGGGGGGGATPITQAMFDAMLAALSRQGQQQTYTPLNLPAFQGQNLRPFNAAPYTQATQALGQAVAADTANVNRNAQNTTNTLNANYTNDYANAQVTPGATQQAVGAGLTGGAAGGNQQAAADVNAGNADSQAAFTNLLGVLAANANQSQASRLNQVSLDQGAALNQIGAQNLGLGAGINMARTQANNQWSQQDAERRYQNSLMAQQWQREQQMQNNQGLNQANQANVQQRNQQMQTTLQPILDLITATGGTSVNMAALLKLLQGQAA